MRYHYGMHEKLVFTFVFIMSYLAANGNWYFAKRNQLERQSRGNIFLAILGWLTENESRFVINYRIIIYQVKCSYSSWKSYHTW